MKIVLASGIYPPDLGGPATYVANLAREFARLGHDVTVVTYGEQNEERREGADQWWTVIVVQRKGGVLRRWRRYAWALRRAAAKADVVEAMSSISVGMPLWMSRVRHPKRILRLGGDFFWERYTDSGGVLPLAEWTAHATIHRWIMARVLRTFDRIAFSTTMQQSLYTKHYGELPSSEVIENALPDGSLALHTRHEPLRILFLGRLVRFKNLAALLLATTDMDDVELTIAGDGPDALRLRTLAASLRLDSRVVFVPSAHGDEKTQLFEAHDLLIIPSITEISPNVALEARAAGLPVLLTDTTGLSEGLHEGMTIARLRSPSDIVSAIRDVIARYDEVASAAASPPPRRSWTDVAEEHVAMFQGMGHED